MKVLALRIRDFRGIETADLVFDDHVTLIGPNGVGKSTIVDALCLVFGRSKLVPTLTEHDFRGSSPNRAARMGGLLPMIQIIIEGRGSVRAAPLRNSGTHHARRLFLNGLPATSRCAWRSVSAPDSTMRT